MVAGYLVTTPPEELPGDQPRALPRARRDRDGSRRFFVTSYTNQRANALQIWLDNLVRVHTV